MNYCNDCGHPLEHRIPKGDHFERAVCPDCGTVHYRNPKVITGCIPVWEGQVLMCRRAIEPRLGRWTFPAGFLEMGETSAHGAAREAREEAHADVEIDGLYAVLNVPHVSQVYLVHRARLRSPSFAPTQESSECVLMREDDIPWDEIAFATVRISLELWFADRARGTFPVHAVEIRRDGQHRFEKRDD